MKLKSIIPALLFPVLSLGAYAATDDFEKNFCDSTLRIDYILTGGNGENTIGLNKMIATEGWYGKRHNMNKVPVQGNGRIYLRDKQTGDTIFMESFSHLFLEWLDTEEAKTTRKSMDAVFRVPLPKNPVEVTVEMYNHHHEIDGAHTFSTDVKNDYLVRRPAIRNVTPHKYIVKNGDPKEKIDVAILAEGFTVAEMDSFYNAAAVAADAILSHEPFRSMADRFNFVAVATPSDDSGVSIPRLNLWNSTSFSSHFGTFYSPRYLTTTDMASIHNSLMGIPYEHIVILANTPEYGGGGIYNSYTLTSAGHKTFRPVVVHEFGHSFGALADEYFYTDDALMRGTYPFDIEPWEQNITTLKNFDAKWKDMLPPGTEIPGTPIEGDVTTVGVYEGGGYSSKGVYRPVDACRMRYNVSESFCPVCQRAIARIIEFNCPSE